MTRKPMDLTGQVIGQLTVLGRAQNTKTKHPAPRWRCLCACGTEKDIRQDVLRNGTVKGCGCLTGRAIKHGKTASKEYDSYRSMLARCYNHKAPNYYLYGGAGITVCDKWKGSFEAFYADMGDRPSRLHTIDRINGKGNYEPANCRWADKRQQAFNRGGNVKIHFRGAVLNLAEIMPFVMDKSISINLVRQRVARYKWDVEEAISLPPNRGRRR